MPFVRITGGAIGNVWGGDNDREHATGQQSAMKPRQLRMIHVLSPLLRLSSVLGVFPLDSELYFSRMRYAYSIVLAIYCTGMRILSVFFIPYIASDFSTLWSVLLTQISVAIAWIVFFIYSPKTKKLQKSITALNAIASVDVYLDYPWLCYSFILVKFIRSVGVLLTLIYHPWLLLFIMLIIDVAYRAPIDLVPLQFACINDLIRQIFVQHQELLDSVALDKNGTILARHYTLCKLTKSVNSYYSPQLMMTFAFTFVLLPPFSYMVVRVNMLASNFMFFFYSEMVLVAYLTFIIVRTSNSLRKQVEKFNERLYLQTRLHPELMFDEKISLFLEYNPQVIPRFLSFEIDYPILLTVMSTCITYVVILFQFGKEDIILAYWSQRLGLT